MLANDRGLDFGIFDWIDDGGGDPGEAYETRLRLLEYADRAGFWGYHLAEHHGTPLGMAPSPNVFLAAVAARTSRLRLGPLVNVVTMYEPLRLLEEICMLDQITRGRLELGLGRGASPVELAYYGVDMPQTKAIYAEAFDVILQGLRTGAVDFEGEYFQYGGYRLSVPPCQRPHPPLWYPTTNVETIPWLGRNAINTVFGFVCDIAFARAGTTVGAQTAVYERELAAHAGDQTRLNAHLRGTPHYGISRHVHVADTDAQAEREARPAHDRFFAGFNHLWRQEQGHDRHTSSFEDAVDRGFFVVGSPATVAERIASQVEEAGGTYYVATFCFGSLRPEQSLRSIELFAERVMPSVRRRLAGRDRPTGAE
jgi:alkanesulfonate monooxygenase SsuD/methylene tetrahydromethanopterin reductase-like flavin-dependent oxidoreductase (luciferase family)